MAPSGPLQDERADRIRECFRQWDKDGKGFITRPDLQAVLTRLLPPGEDLTKEDIDRLMLEADRNCNGRIEYHEFVDWLTRPGASVHATNDEVEYFELDDLLRPLFEIYDRNGDGTISHEEFAECHNILQTALTLHPVEDSSKPADPSIFIGTAKQAFKMVDDDRDARISFDEFAQWQRNALEKSGLLNDDLRDLLPALTRQLCRVFKLAETNERGELLDNDEHVLLHITKNVANFTRDIYNVDEAGHSTLRGRFHYTNRWSEPPVGLNIDRLRGVYLRTMAVPTWGVDDTEMEVVCVPEIEMGDVLHRRWLARVVRKVKYRTGRVETDNPHYYVYSDLLWTLDEGLADEFDKALAQLPPELRVFCRIKVQANFGVQLSWDALQAALLECVQDGLLTEEQHRQYNEHMEALVLNTMRESHVAADQLIAKRIRRKIKLAPRSVMATLVELGILRVTSVWADVLKAEVLKA